MTNTKRRFLIISLDDVHQELMTAHYAAAPRNGIPVGGGDWMDYFFRSEALRGCITALRNGETLEKAIKDGETVAEIAVQLWNKKREWQVHRWEKTAHDFLHNQVRVALREWDEHLVTKEEASAGT